MSGDLAVSVTESSGDVAEGIEYRVLDDGEVCALECSALQG